jgi:NADH-quinone oxidoreductase subunit N
VFIVVGIAFKLGAVPFHVWIPDVYQGGPTAVTLFIAVAPKLAAFAIAIRLLIDTLPGLSIQWQDLLILMSVLSMCLGNIVAILQTSIKRMFAYSSIAHAGYMLLGFCTLSPEGLASSMFYAITYALMSLGGFGILVLLTKNGIEVDDIDGLRGLNKRNPWLALMMLFFLFSMAGIPPTVGFFAKLGILAALISAHLVWLACLALLIAVIGSYYYLRIVKVMYFDQAADEKPLNLSWDAYLGMSINGLSILALGIFPSGLITLCASIFAAG